MVSRNIGVAMLKLKSKTIDNAQNVNTNSFCARAKYTGDQSEKLPLLEPNVSDTQNGSLGKGAKL